MQQTPYGECQCGCGGLAPISPYTDPSRGYLKGEPRRFINNHWMKAKSRRLFAEAMPTGEPDECWEWKGFRNTAGYGRGPHDVPAHRLSWEMHNGPIPDGLFVCHRCDNPPCVNPAHLFLGTAKDNIDDMVRKDRHSKHQRPTTIPDEVVRVIRERHAQGGITQRKLAAEFGVSPAHLSGIVRCERRRAA
jgi:hypothetical protein